MSDERRDDEQQAQDWPPPMIDGMEPLPLPGMDEIAEKPTERYPR